MNRRQRIASINILTKQADSGIVNFIVQSLTPLFNSIKADPIGGIGQLLLEGAIFSSFGWIGAIIVTALDLVFGINVRTLLDTIKRLIVPFMQEHQGQPVNIDSVSETMSNQVMSSIGMNTPDANKPFDQLTDENPQLKTAASLLMHRHHIVKEAGLIPSILKNLTMGGFIKSLIKSLFIGTGFSTAGSAIKNVFTGTSGTGTDAPWTTPAKREPAKIDPSKSILKYVGRPSNSYETTKKYNNDADKDEKNGEAFYIISSGEFERMMYDLVGQTYPNMPEKVANFIERNFNKVIGQVKQEFIAWNKENIDIQGTYIRVPKEIGGVPLNSFKDISDLILSLFVLKQ